MPFEPLTQKAGPHSSPTSSFVYITARAHSGSTILDALIGNGDEAEGLGELLSGWDRYHAPCSCGETIAECPFWSRARREFEKRSGVSWLQAGALQRRQAIATRFAQTVFMSSRSREVQELQRILFILCEVLADVSSKRVVIDSSKEPTRALFLARFVPESKIIHLVRHPAAVTGAVLHRITEGTGFRFLRGTYKSKAFTPVYLLVVSLGWLIGNLLVQFAKFYAPERVLLVRYEDLCADTAGELRRIGTFLGITLEKVVDAVESQTAMPLGHKIAGNRIRTSGTFSFNPYRVESRPLPAIYSVLASILNWPLLWYYGYFRRPVRPTTSPHRGST